MQALLTDSYKYSHYKQYPPGTTNVYSYFESRGGKFDQIVFFGLQYYIKKYLEGNVLTESDINRIHKLIDAHMGPGTFHIDGFRRLLEKHEGRLPIRIWALPEGSVVPPRTPLIAIENTDPEFPWVTNFLETLLVQIWYPVSVASNSLQSRELIKKYLEETCAESKEAQEAILNFRLHDFGMRGVSSPETGAIGGAAHLLSFLGSDTVSAMVLAQDYYGAEGPIAYSIPASEHSTMTSWGQENEIKAFENMLDQYPTGLVACVSDSYDILDAVKNKWGTVLKEKILARDGTLIIRPDSGNPIFTTQIILQSLWSKFGGHVNSKGFKVLDPHVRIIQGDGVDYEMINKILANLKYHGFSAENIAFGSGGALLQKFDRDTAKFAFKCSEVTVNGKTVDVRKKPMEFNSVGDYVHSFKHSKSGRFPELELVFENGTLLREQTFSDIKNKMLNQS